MYFSKCGKWNEQEGLPKASRFIANYYATENISDCLAPTKVRKTFWWKQLILFFFWNIYIFDYTIIFFQKNTSPLTSQKPPKFCIFQKKPSVSLYWRGIQKYNRFLGVLYFIAYDVCLQLVVVLYLLFEICIFWLNLEWYFKFRIFFCFKIQLKYSFVF